jgi:excisionase family DNA binding protein
MDNADIFTIKELANYLKLAEKTAYRLASDGILPGFKVGGAWRFRQTEVDSWIKAQEKKIKAENK